MFLSIPDQRGERGSMIIIVAIAALVGGVGTAFLLWPYGTWIALLAAPLVSSSIALALALMIGQLLSADSAPVRTNLTSVRLLNAISRLLTR
jgi:hypothetical protein